MSNLLPPNITAEEVEKHVIQAMKRGRITQAREMIYIYGKSAPITQKLYSLDAMSMMGIRNWQVAETTLLAATAAYPNSDELWTYLGVTLEQLGKPDDSAIAFKNALAANPKNGTASGNLAALYRKYRRFKEAEELALAAAETSADKSWALTLLGHARTELGKYAEAEEALTQALHLTPDKPIILANMATLYVDQLNFGKAWPFFLRARMGGDSPILRRAEGQACMLSGDDYERGWKLMEARLDIPKALERRPICPKYKGEMFAGSRILLVAEQGLGDTIMFARFGKYLVEQGADLVWSVQPPLHRLLAQNLPGKVVPNNEDMPGVDYYIPLMSLPYLLGRLEPNKWASPAYLKTVATTEMPRKTNKRLKIGLCWTGSPDHPRDHQRSIQLSALWPALEHLDAEFYAPFTGHGLAQIGGTYPINRLDEQLTDFADTAMIINQMDAVVTVDTALAHLSGAMGIKTFTLLAYSPDWRWGYQGEKTTWYESMRLMRQLAPGDWGSATAQLQKALAEL